MVNNIFQKSDETCALCSCSIRLKGYVDAERSFCCTGCHAVYQILSCQKALPNFQNHPLFRQALRSGLISNPELIEQMRQKVPDEHAEEHQKLHLEIQDMWCPSCAQVIYLILMQQKGIYQCVVDYSTDLASIEFSPRHISKEEIYKLIKELGYSPVSLRDAKQKAVSFNLYLRFIVAAFLSLNIMMFSYPIYAGYFHDEPQGYSGLFSWLSFFASIPVLTYCCWPIWRRFFSGLRVGVWGMEALVLMGVTAAFGLSVYEMYQGTHYIYFDSMTVIIVFVLLGKIIESKAKFSAKDSLLRLARGLPRKGRKLFADGSETFVSVKEIQSGDHLVVLTGEKIILDGLVIEGEGSCDESIMTGESLPHIKKIGSPVLSGTILQQGRLVIKVTAKAEETALHRIIMMVEQDLGHKPQYVRAVDQVVKWFVPVVVCLAAITALYCWVFGVVDAGYTTTQTAIIRAISILLISCPCAIGIAAPLAESHLLNALAKMGAIVRNRGVLAFLGKETVFAFDKTGTLTKGKFTVVEGVQKLDYEDTCFLKGLVSYSNHPISVAINQSLCCFPVKLERIEEVIGKGIRGWKGEDCYLLGSELFMQEQNISLQSCAHHDVKHIQSTVYFAKNKECCSQIILGDSIRSDAIDLIQKLSPLNMLLISGDSKRTVEEVANQCGFKTWFAECNPLQKRDIIDQLRNKGEVVAMLGDGINDAPALTAAHIGIAVVSATDISVQVSDILLTTDKLNLIDRIRHVAKKGHRIVKQNLFWAFFYNVVGIGLAIAGWMSPLFAASAMMLSSFIVLINAQRIRSDPDK